LDPQLGGTGLVVVNGDTLRYSTLPDTPKDGWTDATTAGERVLAGERWRLRNVGRLGGDSAWAAARVTAAAPERRGARRALATSGGLMVFAPTVPVALPTQRGRSGSDGVGARLAAVVVPVAAAPGRPGTPGVASSSRELQALYAAALAAGSGNELESTATQT